MSQLTELIDKTIHAIQFNGCTLPESILRHQIENIVACAQLEESMRANQRFLDSIGTAFGNGGNDRPNVIGDMITEPSLTPTQLVKGEWYCLQTKVARINNWIFQFNNYKDGRILFYMCSDKGENTNNMGGFFLHNNVLSIRPATKEEVLKYFPDETFGEPADYVNPITN